MDDLSERFGKTPKKDQRPLVRTGKQKAKQGWHAKGRGHGSYPGYHFSERSMPEKGPYVLADKLGDRPGCHADRRGHSASDPHREYAQS